MKFNFLLLTCALTVSSAFAQVKAPAVTSFAEHGGGNGGDDIELELKKKSLQIGYFLKSEVGKKVFNIINGDAALEAIERTDIDVVTGNVVDKYGTIRTCVNESDRSLITCNLDRLNELKKKNQTDVLTAMLFHEILGIMGVELGYQENVSMYPISSKIMPYDTIVAATPVSEANIRPEYFGLDSRSYGITIINKDTKETIRMICLNSNVEIHRCRNYSLVRSANGIQAPLINNVISLSPAQISQISLESVKPADLVNLEAKLSKLQASGFKYMSLRGTTMQHQPDSYSTNESAYRFGVGAGQMMTSAVESSGSGWFLAALIGMAELDIAVEASKQVLNIGIWPIKSIVNGLRVASMKSEVKSFNKKISIARDVLNLKNELSLVGTSKKVSDKDFQTTIEILKQAIVK